MDFHPARHAWMASVRATTCSRFTLLFAIIVVSLNSNGCVSVPRTPLSVAEYELEPHVADVARWRNIYTALRFERDGQLDAAIDAWLGSPPTAWTGMRLAALAERRTLNARQLQLLESGGSAWAEATAIAAVEAGYPEAYRAAVRSLGAIGSYERCGALIAEHDVVDFNEDPDGWPIILGDPPCHHVPAADGWLSPERIGSGLQRYRFGSDASAGAAFCVEIIGELPWRLRAGSEIIAVQRSDRALLPLRRKLAFERHGPFVLDVLHDGSDEGLRVFIRRGPGCDDGGQLPPGPAAGLARADLARREGRVLDSLASIGKAETRRDPSLLLATVAAHLADHTLPEGLRAERGLETLGPPAPTDAHAIRLLRARLLLETGRTAEARDVSDIMSETQKTGLFNDLGLLRLQLADLEEDRHGTWMWARELLEAGGQATCEPRRLALQAVAPWLLPNDIDPKAILNKSLPLRGPCAELHVLVADTLVALGRVAEAENIMKASIDPSLPAWPARLRDSACLLMQRIARKTGPERAPTDADPCSTPDAARVPTQPVFPTRPAEMRHFLLTATTHHQLPVTDTANISNLIRTALKAPLSDYFEVILNERVDAPLPDGRLVSRHHRVLCFHDPDATTRLGEIALSPSATPIIARTWKVHRSTSSLLVQPIDLDEGDSAPDTISLPALEPGDCAELLWFDEQPPTRGIAPGFLAPTFYFDDDQGPTHLARWALLSANVTAPLVAVPTFPATDGAVLRPIAKSGGPGFEAGPLAAAVPEPLDPRADLRRFSIRPAAGHSEERRLRTLGWDLRTALRPSPAAVAFEAALKASTVADPVNAVVQAVFDAIDDTDDAPTDATLAETHARGRGSRALAMLGAARSLGLPAALVLARPLSDGGPGAPDDEPEAFAWPLIIFGGHNPRVIDPRSPDNLPPPTLCGVDAVVMAGDGDAWQAGTRVKTPEVPPGERAVDLKLKVDPDLATLTGTGAERLSGTFAQAWRGVIQRIPEDNRERLMSQVAEPSFPRLTTSNHVLEGVSHTDPALEWRFDVKGPLARISPDRLELHLRLAPDDPLNASGRVSRRRNPLFFNMIARMTVVATVVLPDDWHPTNLPADVVIDAFGFRYRREIRWNPATRELRIEKHWATDPRWVEVEDFSGFRAIAARVTQSDDLRVDLVHTRLFGSENTPMSPFSPDR